MRDDIEQAYIDLVQTVDEPTDRRTCKAIRITLNNYLMGGYTASEFLAECCRILIEPGRIADSPDKLEFKKFLKAVAQSALEEAKSDATALVPTYKTKDAMTIDGLEDMAMHEKSVVTKAVLSIAHAYRTHTGPIRRYGAVHKAVVAGWYALTRMASEGVREGLAGVLVGMAEDAVKEVDNA